MASHGKSRHTKRLGAVRLLKIPRKNTVWIKTTRAGKHSKDSAIPLVVLLRDLLKICRSSKEVKKLVFNGQVLVDGKLVKDVGFQVGLMDIVTMKNYKSFIILIDKGIFVPVEIQETSTKLCRIIGKRFVKKGKVQLTLHDGKTLIVDKNNNYSPGDTLKVSIPKLSIVEHLKLEKGSNCYVFKGRHAGAIGSLVQVHVYPGITPSNARIVDKNMKEVVTLKAYVFVVDKNFKV